MAALRGNWYLREVGSGNLQLPAYEQNENWEIKIHYGEIFCRVEDCSKATHKYTATNNLRSHIASHGEHALPGGNLGGRASQKEIDEAARWYKSLFAGIEPNNAGAAQTPSTVSHGRSISIDSTSPATPSLPPLPRKQGGSIHITNMRKQAVNLGGTVPCESCSNRNDCCKDINKYDNFILFDCGNIHPTPAARYSTANTETTETEGAEERTD
ncbi:uncharacterized protein BDV17DRAFT_278553 [Aspergillus undulatus]|uniref:uncharacterized protein n=1 Tax=Aspergillus undulatus TaxID=1810928 RepID=UPI003CCE27FC